MATTNTYMKLYMRRRRKAEKEGRANTKQALSAQARKRAKEWYLDNRDRKIAQVALYAAANREKSNEWKSEWRERNRPTCPFCPAKTYPNTASCAECRMRYGALCKGNHACGVFGEHKHCPRCSMPLSPRSRHRLLEECAFCVADRTRGAHMGTRETDSDEEVAA